LTLFNGELIQLTWKAHKARIYNVDSFDLVREAVYAGEGWGLTHDGTRLILSDGTSTLRFFDPAAFNEIGSVEVHADDRPIENLNELEYIDGEIYANIWRTDRIARIDPETGRVLAWIDLAGLLEDAEGAQRADVLNGIAYDAISRRLFVTGKLWPALFEIELIKPEESLWHAGAQ
ncbi:MAG TPA: glutaminyl-peptide cyclotransferase, partial [Candidatus Hydrogenedentes bacterium]|nr:glutaminyl-peptide cyclotransferase [Candidatus Hydrogenedentota bacterium]